MSLSSLISDLCRSLTVSDVQAEATPAEERVESQSKEESKEEEPEAEQGPEKKDEEGGEEEEKEKEEEDDDEEPQDPAPAIMKGSFPSYVFYPESRGNSKLFKQIGFTDRN